MILGNVFQTVHRCRNVTKGNISAFLKKYIYFWRDVIYFTYVDFRFTKYIPQKNSPVLISF